MENTTETEPIERKINWERVRQVDFERRDMAEIGYDYDKVLAASRGLYEEVGDPDRLPTDEIVAKGNAFLFSILSDFKAATSTPLPVIFITHKLPSEVEGQVYRTKTGRRLAIALSAESFIESSRAVANWENETQPQNTEALKPVAAFAYTVLHEMAHIRQRMLDPELEQELMDRNYSSASHDEYITDPSEINAHAVAMRFIAAKKQDPQVSELWRQMDFTGEVDWLETIARTKHHLRQADPPVNLPEDTASESHARPMTRLHRIMSDQSLGIRVDKMQRALRPLFASDLHST